MIVMKFGGSSVESPEAMHRVSSIIKTNVRKRPVVVVSAIGKTTNQLLTMAEQASRGHGYGARKALSAIQDTHYQIADELVFGAKLEVLERSLRSTFRELHGAIHDLSEDGGCLSPKTSDYIASFGERLSSEILAAALLQMNVPAVHVEAREFILTDDRHGSATPMLWETYARLRRSIPQVAQEVVVVMGGFIGATEAGVTTTLGRGGSDLTASIVGAGIGAEEIQIWTDVDGMLTCDPRVLPSVYRVRSLSFKEAATLAGSGAKVLHPDTIQPALKQRIPVTIRNSRKPQQEGTSITCTSKCPPSGVKAIALKENLLILEITSSDYPTGSELLAAIEELCFRKAIEPKLLCGSSTSVFLGLSNHNAFDSLTLDLPGCVDVHLHPGTAVITLVGASLPLTRARAADRVRIALKNVFAQLLPSEDDAVSLQMIVPQSECRDCCDRLHREFFPILDLDVFDVVEPEPVTLNANTQPTVTFARRKVALLSRYSLPTK